MDFNTKLLGPTHPRTERVGLALCDILWSQCRVNDAADLQEHLLQLTWKAFGPNHLRTLRLLDKLGESRRQQGRFAESRQMALDKRAELTGSKMSVSGRTSTSLLSGKLSTDLEPAELDSGLHATSTGTQVIVTGAEDLRMRSSPRTW